MDKYEVWDQLNQSISQDCGHYLIFFHREICEKEIVIKNVI